MAQAGYGRDVLKNIRTIIEAENADLLDVLEYVAYATTPMERSIRVERLADYMKNLPQAQHDFVEYLINAYIVNGIDELAMQKLATLLELKFGSLIEGVSALGGASAAQQTFRDFQRELYA